MGAIPQISLIGLSGVGKSTIGEMIAANLGWSFLDTDILIEEETGSNPAELITSKGELFFREIEERVIIEATQNEFVVISTGGGAFLSPQNRRNLGANGYICFLDATHKVISEHLKNYPRIVPRPLLGDSPEALESRLYQLDKERRDTYQHADLWVPVQNMFNDFENRSDAISEVVTRILRAWSSESRQLLESSRRLERLAEIDLPAPPSAIVDTGIDKYPIWIGPEELNFLPDRLRQLDLTNRRVFMICDSNVIDLHGTSIAEILDRDGIAGASYILPAGEESKKLEIAKEIYTWLGTQNAERRDLILAVGGGVVGDLAGYVASTYLRGIPFIQIPTTVLAMNDAAIGGKVAVDLPDGKNLVGSFYQPKAVISDVSTLTTLPSRSFNEGFAELIKHGFILDPDLLFEMKNLGNVHTLQHDVTRLSELTARSARLKALVVSSDPREENLRMILNYGHTIGHAIETVSNYTEYLHGEAVAIGMMGAARIARHLEMIDDELLAMHSDLLRLFSLPTEMSDMNINSILQAMKRDKKVESGKLRFVLLEDIAKPVVRSDVPESVVIRVLKEISRS